MRVYITFYDNGLDYGDYEEAIGGVYINKQEALKELASHRYDINTVDEYYKFEEELNSKDIGIRIKLNDEDIYVNTRFSRAWIEEWEVQTYFDSDDDDESKTQAYYLGL